MEIFTITTLVEQSSQFAQNWELGTVFLQQAGPVQNLGRFYAEIMTPQERSDLGVCASALLAAFAGFMAWRQSRRAKSN